MLMKTGILALALTAVLAGSGCAPPPVPVTPAPLEAAKQDELKQALLGRWEWVANLKPRGERYWTVMLRTMPVVNAVLPQT
jgi:hypothetical protein